MPTELTRRLSNLLTVKSLVTIILTVVFAAMTVMGRVDQDFLTIYSVIIAFYFGTQVGGHESGARPEAGA